MGFPDCARGAHRRNSIWMSPHVDAPADRILTSLLRALAEPVRWRIVEALASEELCVCHLAADLGIDQPSVSHHLRVLRDTGLVEGERYRYWTYYRLRPAALAAAAERLAIVAGGVPDPGAVRRPCC